MSKATADGNVYGRGALLAVTVAGNGVVAVRVGDELVGSRGKWAGRSLYKGI